LKRQFSDVHLVVADGLGDECTDAGVEIHDVGVPGNRFSRYFKTANAVFEKAMRLDADIYQFHDPELSRICLKLQKLGKIVVYDVHEDLPRQILTKAYIPKFLRPIISRFSERNENRHAKHFNQIITATDFIRDRFKPINQHVVSIKNYPILETMQVNTNWDKKSQKLCYIGGLTEVRGIFEMVEVMQYVDAELHLVGAFDDESFRKKVMQSKGWCRVIEHGYLDRGKVNHILEDAKIGFVLLHPTKNYVDALPVKMFEYMAAGIPFVVTDVPLWRQIVDENQCAVCVDPFNTIAVADVINALLADEETAKAKGENGKRAVESKYNWEEESQKYLAIYERLAYNLS
jgi:glycosyltransferase involved in cell wall biosynthesis